VKTEYRIAANDTGGAKPGELVLAEVLHTHRLGVLQARVVEHLGRFGEARTISLISIHEHDIPTEFPRDALDLAKGAMPVTLGERTDLRAVPLVTIDPEDARDHDDAVWAAPDDDKNNPGGFRLLVAIADVAHYVRPGDALDREAEKRGNSVYFPIASCRCCRRRSPTACARCVPTRTGPASPSRWSSTARARSCATASCAR